MPKLHISTWVDDAYEGNDLCGWFGTDSYDVELQHIDYGAAEWVKRYGKPIFLKMPGPMSFDTVDDCVRRWDTACGRLLKGVILPDEPTMHGYTVEAMVDTHKSVKAASGLPTILNIVCADDNIPYIREVRADITSTSAYFNVSESGRPQTEQDVRGAMRWLRTVCAREGLTRANGHALGFVIQMFRHQVYKNNVERFGVPFCERMYDIYGNALYEELGEELSWLSMYAARPKDVFDGDMPNNHPEMWPVVKYGTAKIKGMPFRPLFGFGDADEPPPPPLPPETKSFSEEIAGTLVSASGRKFKFAGTMAEITPLAEVK